jgi:predicted lysophospholipase L1 biosynthesis ABC-type transport system permease subunit
VIIGETLARRHFGSATAALDRRIKVGPQESEPWLTVVGVVNDVHNERLEAADEYATYEPHPQRPWRTMYVTIRTDGTPIALAETVRLRLLRSDPAMLIEDVTTLTDRIRGTVASRRITSQLVALLGSIAVLLAAIGTYGLIASSVTDRRRELAVRAAVGADRSNLLRLVVIEGTWLGLTGTVLGAAGALAAGTALRGLLFGSNGRELESLLLAGAVLLCAALVASWVPARRAAAVPAAEVLRA